MKSLVTCTSIGSLLLVGSTALAATGTPDRPMHARQTSVVTTHVAQPTVHGPSTTGQPNQSCGSAAAPNTPGNTATAPGSAFNPSGTAGTVYAGQQPQNSVNIASVSQYDVACAHQRR
ncbi:hypothetical protein ACFQAT_18050 [Undibacterium arcticum]|uniref:Adenylate cyclase n=1 Tax=Undibacterium arcticum TaxID=1762892 RepID=A0ABV7F5W7_9BURK